MAKQMQFFTVRNASKQFLGVYRAYTAKQAIDRLISDQQVYASTFRKSGQIKIDRAELTAQIETTS